MSRRVKKATKGKKAKVDDNLVVESQQPEQVEKPKSNARILAEKQAARKMPLRNIDEITTADAGDNRNESEIFENSIITKNFNLVHFE